MKFQMGTQPQQARPVDPATGEQYPTAAGGAAGIDGGLNGGCVIVDAVTYGTEGQNIVLHGRNLLAFFFTLPQDNANSKKKEQKMQHNLKKKAKTV
jgi:hypothetical protein